MSERKAFTLIEMLIVVAIIALLAMIAVGAYSGARRSAQIDIIADNLVSSLKLQQGLSKSGRVTADTSGLAGSQQGKSKCYGMSFKTGGGEGSQPAISYVETPYYTIHPNKPTADVCDLSEKEERDFEMDVNYELFMMEAYFDGNEKEDLLILFKPPFGRIVISEAGADPVSFQQGVHPFINFGISLPNNQNPKYFRFDTTTGLAERYYVQKL